MRAADQVTPEEDSAGYLVRANLQDASRVSEPTSMTDDVDFSAGEARLGKGSCSDRWRSVLTLSQPRIRTRTCGIERGGRAWSVVVFVAPRQQGLLVRRFRNNTSCDKTPDHASDTACQKEHGKLGPPPLPGYSSPVLGHCVAGLRLDRWRPPCAPRCPQRRAASWPRPRRRPALSPERTPTPRRSGSACAACR
ncbi:hypothetical protein HPB50_006598 [Hyalomma asiaticum]|uniref:Uncharacterized protein n=1 Tax=Hyalomma asiaticum TaxID=266040 RepID=A0ACB7SLD0_HYAAI|nr:hypothetical protein HPB50_006598 [Hyalomma asiaticum]